MQLAEQQRAKLGRQMERLEKRSAVPQQAPNGFGMPFVRERLKQAERAAYLDRAGGLEASLHGGVRNVGAGRTARQAWAAPTTSAWDL